MTEEVKERTDALLAEQAEPEPPKRPPGRRPLNHPFRGTYKTMVPVPASEDRVFLEASDAGGSIRIRVKEEPAE